MRVNGLMWMVVILFGAALAAYAATDKPVVPHGVWVENGVDVLKPCPTDLTAVGWLPGGCSTPEPGVWRSLEQDKKVVAARRELQAEVRVLNEELDKLRERLGESSVELEKCASSLRLAADLIPAVQQSDCPSQWPAAFVGGVAGAIGGFGLGWGVSR